MFDLRVTNQYTKKAIIIKSIVLFTLLGWGSSRILTNKNKKQSPRGNEVIIGDMILTQEQYEFLYGPRKRNGNPVVVQRWPNKTLPYKISDSFAPNETALIESTIDRFNDEMGDCFNIV